MQTAYHCSMLYEPKALFAPQIFVFDIFIDNLEEDTGCRLLKCVQKISLASDQR